MQPKVNKHSFCLITLSWPPPCQCRYGIFLPQRLPCAVWKPLHWMAGSFFPPVCVQDPRQILDHHPPLSHADRFGHCRMAILQIERGEIGIGRISAGITPDAIIFVGIARDTMVPATTGIVDSAGRLSIIQPKERRGSSRTFLLQVTLKRWTSFPPTIPAKRTSFPPNHHNGHVVRLRALPGKAMDLFQ